MTALSIPPAAPRAALPALVTDGLELERQGAVFARLPALTLNPGQSVALTGPSGSGKTTAILALTGIRAPHKGRVEIAGTDLWTLRAAARDRFRGQRIGLVFQSFHLIDAVSVKSNLRLAASCAGLKPDPAHLDALLARLGIADLQERPVTALSAGQAQRVALARALVNRPALVIADEPTSALDDGNAKALLKLLNDTARAQDCALLIATHDRRVLESVQTTIAMERIS